MTRRWPWLLLDVVLVCLAAAAAVGLVREVVEGRSLPPARAVADPGPRPAADGPTDAAAMPPRAEPGDYAVIATRNLFSAARGEAVVTAAVPASGPPSILHGVLIDGAQSRAYMDDPVAKRVFGYTLGDTVPGGRLERILDDRVVIRGPQGPIEVLLRDPSKPVPEPAAPRAASKGSPAGQGPTAGAPVEPAAASAAPLPGVPAPPTLPAPTAVPGQEPIPSPPPQRVPQ